MAEEAIAVLTSGGDAPGMNVAIATVVKAAQCRNVTQQDVAVLGIRRGYAGLVGQEGDFVSLKLHSVAGILRTSGTILGSARLPELKHDDEFTTWASHALHLLKRKCVRGLIVLGGDGSLQGARKHFRFCHEKGYAMPVVGIPSSIDNDVPGTDYCLGSDTAVNTTMRILDSLVGTAHSHGRTFLVETMGARAGYLALMAALTGESELAFLPEDDDIGAEWRLDLHKTLRAQFASFCANPSDPAQLAVRKRQATVVLAEEFNKQQRCAEGDFVADVDRLHQLIDEYLSQPDLSDERKTYAESDKVQLGQLQDQGEPFRTQEFLAIADRYCGREAGSLPLEIRSSVPGHIVRGEAPTGRDRILACRLALRAVQCIINYWRYDSRLESEKHADFVAMDEGEGLMIGIRGNQVTPTYVKLVNREAQRLNGRISTDRAFFFKEPRELLRIFGAPPIVAQREPNQGRRLGVMTAGADAPGMNATIRAVVRTALHKGIEPWGVRNGFVGLALQR